MPKKYLEPVNRRRQTTRTKDNGPHNNTQNEQHEPN